jgi:glutamate-ammonia-ligase adenylyltransferase
MGHTEPVAVPDLDDAIEHAAAPAAARLSIERIAAAWPDAAHRLHHDRRLAHAVVSVTASSRTLARVLETDDTALRILSDLDRRPSLDASSPATLARWKQLEELRIAARDLSGQSDLRTTVAAISALARDVLEAAVVLSGAEDHTRLSVIGMGKLGGAELNYASDIDVMFVGEGTHGDLERAARRVLEVTRPCFRVDANLRPEGRDGPLVRTLESYEAYWDRWAEPWEFQALLKASAAAGDADLGAAFEQRASSHLWSRRFSADDLRALRRLKARAEAELARKGLTDREVKRGRGGIRDIEFAVQLLQLVHGRLDPDLRSATTLVALQELAAAGYVDARDASGLADAYIFLRRVEHVLQLYDNTQVYAMPPDAASRLRIARALGFRDSVKGSAIEQLDTTLTRHQSIVRSIHERLYFRPLLEAFSSSDADLLSRPGAVDARLVAFGFSDTTRARAAVEELTRGLTRSSRLMQQMLPLLVGWISETPDPDLGLLCLRTLAGTPPRATELARSFRESPQAAQRLCALIGTSRIPADIIQRNLDLIDRLPDSERLLTQPSAVLGEKAHLAVGWREGEAAQQAALMRWKHRNLLGVIARDVFGDDPVPAVAKNITAIAEAAVSVSLDLVRPALPFGVIALGRFAGAELSYASDLDVVFVYDGTTPADHEEGMRIATTLRRFLQGATPASRLWPIDVDLRPEGKQGLLARSLDGYRTYFERWALVWERQAMMRARAVAGDPAVTDGFLTLLHSFVWEPGLSSVDVKEIRRLKARMERERLPAGEDPQFHLKLGRGSLSDVEWTTQLLQLQHDVRAPGTMDAIGALVDAHALDPGDAAVIAESYRFTETTRNRLFLVRSRAGDALPRHPDELLRLARSLGTTPVELREQYRRVTRRARTAVERLFYGRH